MGRVSSRLWKAAHRARRSNAELMRAEGDPAYARSAAVLNVVSLSVAIALIVIAAFNVISDPEPAFRIGAAVVLLAVIAFSRWLLRRGRVVLAGHFFTALLWVVLFVAALFSGGVASPGAATLVSVTLIAGLVLGVRPALWYTLFSVAGLFAAYLLERAGRLPPALMTYEPFAAWSTVSAGLIFTAVVLAVGLRQLQMALGQAHENEAALRESEHRVATLVREAPLGIVALDATGRVQSFNPAAERITGREAREVVGRELFEALALPPDEADERRNELEAALAGQPLIASKWEVSTSEGDRRVVQVAARSFATDGGPVVQAMLEDVTEEVSQRERSQALEEQLHHRQRLESVGLLAGGIAHDFNNLLTVMLASMDLIKHQVPKDSPLLPHVSEVQLASERAASLTRQLLAFSRRQLLQPRALDLNQLVEGSSKMLRRVIAEDIALRLELDPSITGIHADPGQIEQVIVNLALNARDAMPEGGTITLRTRATVVGPEQAVPVGVPEPGPYAVLEVEDTGTGMDEETQGRIFDPFFTTKEPGKGTGLGLSTTLGIVKQSGGGISVESTPGTGTVFRLHLPASPAPSLRPPSEAPRGARGAETILLAEDDDAVRRLVTRILESAGYRVLQARSGEHALAVAAAHEGAIHLLITDAVMPEMGGGQLIERLGADRPDTKVLVISGYTDETLGMAAHDLEELDFLLKPFSPDELAAKVRDVLDRAAPVEKG